MSAHLDTLPAAVRRERGFTLVELMVTVAIALFLLGGLGMIVQRTRDQNLNQQALAVLQDEQRFATTVLTDIVQAGGHYPCPSATPPACAGNSYTQSSALPAVGVIMQPGQAFYGVHTNNTTPDTLTVRFMTTAGDGLIRCDGSSNTAVANEPDTNVFSVVLPAGNVPGRLQCSFNGGAPVTLVNGVQNLQVYYGVNRNTPTLNYNVDTYLTADQMNAANGDWMNISAVRVVLTFTNPLCPNGPGPTCQAGQQLNPTIAFERVVPVMGRAGFHS